MTKSEAKPAIAAVNELFSKSPDGLREVVRAVVQEMLEAKMMTRSEPRRASALARGLATAPAITPARSSPGSASSSCACRRIATAGSRPNSSSAISAPSGPWCQSASNFDPQSALKGAPLMETCSDGSVRPGGAGRGCAAGASADR